MDYNVVSLVLLTVLVGTVSSFVVYLYMKMGNYLNDIHHRIDNEVNHVNNDIETIKRNIIDVSNEKISKLNNELDILNKRIDEVYQQQRHVDEELRRMIDSKFEKIQNDNKVLLKD
jgi:peptidoglycan hydrolase CwlO-like protein